MIRASIIKHYSGDHTGGVVFDIRGHAEKSVCGAVTALTHALDSALMSLAADCPKEILYSVVSYKKETVKRKKK